MQRSLPLSLQQTHRRMNDKYIYRDRIYILTPEGERYFRAAFPSTKNQVIADHLGIHRNTVTRLAQTLGIEKDEEFLQKLRMANFTAIAKPRPQEFKDKMSAIRKRMYASERRRVLYGLPQQTNMVIRVSNYKERRQRIVFRYRMKRLGYIVPPDDFRTVYYDDNTPRARKAERHAPEIGISIKHISNF